MLAMALCALPFGAAAHVVPDREVGPYTYLRELTLRIDPGISLAARDMPMPPGPRYAQEGPERSMIPPARPGAAAVLSDARPVEASDVGRVQVVAASDGSILRPRPRPGSDAAQVIDSARARTQGTAMGDLALSPVTAETIIPRPRPAALAARVVAPSVAPAPDPGSPTPAVVRQQATDANNIDLDRMSLIGVFGTDRARRALVRLPDGSRVRVATGTEVSGWRVLAVDARSVRMIRGGEVLLLELP